MAKDFKEKYEKVCTIKDRALSLVDMQLNGNIENVDGKPTAELIAIDLGSAWVAGNLAYDKTTGRTAGRIEIHFLVQA